MPAPEARLPDIYVQPGESWVVAKPAILRTLLGSCVGITCWIPRLGVGALCHPMLPRYPPKPLADSSREAGLRYVDYAIRNLARQFDAMTARRNEIEVKLFGGGDVLLVASDSMQPTVGKLNCNVALTVLEEERFQVVASSLGGNCGVNIHFNTKTGEVLLKRHARAMMQTPSPLG